MDQTTAAEKGDLMVVDGGDEQLMAYPQTGATAK